MPSQYQAYQLVSTEDDNKISTHSKVHRSSTFSDRKLTASITCLLISLITNGLLLMSLSKCSHCEMQGQGHNDSRTPYANLERNLPIPLERPSPYSTHNLTENRRLWEDISIDDGMIALPDASVGDFELPEAQRFPWDSNKGLYFLNGFHNLHCLRAVHISLLEFATGEQQSRRFGHVLHCMNSLREDILCNADDTPRYTTSSKVPESGVGQVRLCRDWSRLEEWARQYNACYRFINQTATGFPNVYRYRFCPEGSPYKEEVDEIFETLAA